MSSVDSVLRESVLYACGLSGVLRFSEVCRDSYALDDGSPDMAGIREALAAVLTGDQAAAVLAYFTKRMEIYAREPAATAPAPASANEGDVQAVQKDRLLDAQTLETSQVFKKYFNADPNHVRDIVNEARRVRMAMGKSINGPVMLEADNPSPDGIMTGPVRIAKAVIEKTLEDKPSMVEVIGLLKMEAAMPEPVPESSPEAPAAEAPAPAEVRMPHAVVVPESEIDREIADFVYGQDACSSIDIMDFIRYLKDKGYSFQEYIVLEKIYVIIEEKKKAARSAIEKEVEGLFMGAQGPAEPEISGFFKRLKSAGLTYEEDDVRRMIRTAALRRA